MVEAIFSWDGLVGMLKVLGSLGVFLFGMKVMSEGIQKVAGGKLRQIMATMTANRGAGLFTGFVVTCLIQSSSATTVMVVSFVNAGLLTLVESLGVIMGANLGTTVTAWLIASVGKFSLASWALPIVGVGLPLFFAFKGKKKATGEFLIGFGLLFLGLDELKNSVPDVRTVLEGNDPAHVALAAEIRAMIDALSGHGFGSVLMFLVFGVVLTLMVQSSSAAMAVTLMLSINGWIDFSMGAAIILGENIGTTVTAYLASIGANANAKRAARAHFAFNMIGVIWVLAILLWLWLPMVEYLGEMWFPAIGEGVHESPIGFNLALHHSLFNLANIVVLIGFVPLLAKLVTRWVPDATGHDSRRGRLTFITQGMVGTGELNLAEAQSSVREMADLTADMFSGFREVFDHPDKDMSARVVELKGMEEVADQMTSDLTHFLVRLSAAELGEDNANLTAAMLRMVSELEETADGIYRLVKLAQRKYEDGVKFEDEPLRTIREVCDVVTATIELYRVRMFERTTMEDIQLADRHEFALDEMRRKLNKDALDQIRDGLDPNTGILAINLHNHLEKLGNHALHILEENHRVYGDPE